MAFGRASFSGNNIIEKGFCWSTHKNPTVLDNRSTLSYNNNGSIYVMDGLLPSSLYYIRPYAITNGYAVGYGESIRICTLPMGNITWTYNNGGSEDENKRINSAIDDAVNVWNNITSIQGLHLSVSYGANTETADCSYGGSMRVGPNASYQRRNDSTRDVSRCRCGYNRDMVQLSHLQTRDKQRILVRRKNRSGGPFP